MLYVNSDTNGRGFLQAEGSHALQHFVSEAARDVKDPETGASVLARALAERRVADYESAARANPARADASGDIAARRAGLGLGLHAVPAAPGRQFPEPGVRR